MFSERVLIYLIWDIFEEGVLSVKEYLTYKTPSSKISQIKKINTGSENTQTGVQDYVSKCQNLSDFAHHGKEVAQSRIDPGFQLSLLRKDHCAPLSLLMRNSHHENAFRIAPYQKTEAMHFATVLHNTSFLSWRSRC